MNEHRTPEASPNTFDGAAISRADREFLASLGNHPLVRHPLYSVPPPPRPDRLGGAPGVFVRIIAADWSRQRSANWPRQNELENFV